MKTYGIISDSHNHNWSAFSITLPTGINSRLQMILDETKRCADEVRKAGGDTIFHGGDLFHVRGSVAPSVLNPTLDCYRTIIKSGMKIVVNAGNHDLEDREANDIGSAITALREVGCTIVNSHIVGTDVAPSVVLVPWIANIEKLKEAIEYVDPVDRKGCDLIIHAGIDGVMAGLPSHGLTKEYLEVLGYKRVFAGHYHHHKHLGNGIYSIGALTHQTWSDVNSKAGFLIVGEEKDDVKWFASRAPSFIDIDATTDPSEIPLIADGNYVRAKIFSTKSSDVESLRSHLIDCGAVGVSIMAQPATGATRVSSTVKAGASLEVSVSDYVKASEFDNKEELNVLCASILTEVKVEE